MSTANAIQRKYVVALGYTVGDQFPGALVAGCGDDTIYIVPLEELPITLTYKPEKAKGLPRNSEKAIVEAQDRAITVWRKRHPDAEFNLRLAVGVLHCFGVPCDLPTLTGFDVKAVWERQIVDTIGLQ